MTRKTIAFVLTDMHMGGIPKAAIPLLKQLKRYYDVMLVLTNGEGALIKMIPEGIPIDILPAQTYKMQLAEAVRQLRIIPAICSLAEYKGAENWIEKTEARIKLRPKLTQHYDCAIAFFGMNAKCLLVTLDMIDADKKIAWIHGDHPFQRDELSCVNEIYHRFDKIYCASMANLEAFLRDFPAGKKKAEVFYPLVDEDQVHKLAKVEHDSFYKKGITNILTVGRISPEKGQDMIPVVAKNLRNNGFDFNWTLVGDGPSAGEIKKNAELLGVSEVLVFAGSQQNPYPFFADCDVFVQPSYTEGYSIVTREAAMFGKPIIATRVGGQPEGFTDGFDILLVEPNAEDITNALISVLKWPEKRKMLAQNIAKGSYSNIGEMQKLTEYLG